MRIATLVLALVAWASAQIETPTPEDVARDEVRREAARFPSNRGELQAHLGSEDWTQRLRAAEILVLLAVPEARELLASRDLLADPAWPIRALGLRAAADASDAMGALRRGAADPLWPVRRATARAAGRHLHRCGSAAAAELLVELLRDPAPEVRADAIAALIATVGLGSVADPGEVLRDESLGLDLRLRVADDLLLAHRGVVGHEGAANDAMASARTALALEAGEAVPTARVLEAWKRSRSAILHDRLGAALVGRPDLPEILAARSQEADRELLHALLDGADQIERRAILWHLLVGHRDVLDVATLLRLCLVFDRRDLSSHLFACVERPKLGVPPDRYLSAALRLDPDPPVELLRRGLASDRLAVRQLCLESLVSRDPATVLTFFGDDLDEPSRDLSEVPAERRVLLPNLARILHRLPPLDALRIGRGLAAAHDHGVRRAALRSLARLPEGRALLGELFSQPGWFLEGRHEILEALYGEDRDAALTLARRSVVEGDAETIIPAAEILRRGDARDFAPLLRLWVGRWPYELPLVRAWAGLDDRAEIARFVREQLATSPARFGVALAAVRSARLPESLPLLMESALSCEDISPGSVGAVLQLAREMPAPSFASHLRELLDDSPAGLRRHAIVETLAVLGDGAARDELLGRYRDLSSACKNGEDSVDHELERVAMTIVEVAPKEATSLLASDIVELGLRWMVPEWEEPPPYLVPLGVVSTLMDALAYLPREQTRVSTARALAEVDPLRLPAAFIRAWVRNTAWKRGRSGDPVALFHLLERDPSAADWVSARMWYDLGAVLEVVDEPELAARAYEQSLFQGEVTFYGYVARGLGPVDFLRGRDPWLALRARPHLLRAALLPPAERAAEMAAAEGLCGGEVGILLGLARLHLEDGGDVVAAQRLLERALRRAGPEREILELLAEAARQGGDVDAAARFAERARRTRFGAE